MDATQWDCSAPVCNACGIHCYTVQPLTSRVAGVRMRQHMYEVMHATEHRVVPLAEYNRTLQCCRTCTSNWQNHRQPMPRCCVTNGLNPGPVPPVLRTLNRMEHQLLCPVQLFMTMCMLPHGSELARTRLHVLLPINLESIATVLPATGSVYVSRPTNPNREPLAQSVASRSAQVLTHNHLNSLFCSLHAFIDAYVCVCVSAVGVSGSVD